MFLKSLVENFFYERHFHPSIYEKIRKTESLQKEGVNPDEFLSKGGLDLDTYNALQDRWSEREKINRETKQKMLSNFKSLTNVPSSLRPCKKITPAIGNKNALVLLTEFKDKTHSHEPEEFKELLFSKGSNNSMRDYYLEASWNQLDINGYVNDEWYILKNNYSEYVDKDIRQEYPNARKLVEETLLKAKNSGKIDFTSHAKDGKIEILIIVYAGNGADTKNNINYILPHQGKLLRPFEVQDGIKVERYCIVSENPFTDIGCYCHEVAHLLGLPDLYREKSFVIGSWCLMGLGDLNNDGKTPAHPSAWCKIQLGWIEPQLIDQNSQNYEIPSVIEEKVIYKIEVPGSGGKEYFLLENRQQKGFDEHLPSTGLLIWHIDENACIYQAPNADPECPFLTLEQSDGKIDLQIDRIMEFPKPIITKDLTIESPLKYIPKVAQGDSGDPFPGITSNRIFDDESIPSSKTYKGNRSFIKVDSISDSKDIMNAEIRINSSQRDILIQFDSNKISEKNPQMLINPFFINLLYSIPKEKSPYEKGYDNAKEEFYEELKEKSGIKSYEKGYRSGFRKGYDEAFKSLK